MSCVAVELSTSCVTAARTGLFAAACTFSGLVLHSFPWPSPHLLKRESPSTVPGNGGPRAPTGCPGQDQEGGWGSRPVTAAIRFLLTTTFEKNHPSVATRVFYTFLLGEEKLSECFIRQELEHCHYKRSFPNEFPELTWPEFLLSGAVLPSLSDCRGFARKPTAQAPASSRWSQGGCVVQPRPGWSPENPQTVWHHRKGARAAVLTQVLFRRRSEPVEGLVALGTAASGAVGKALSPPKGTP